MKKFIVFFVFIFLLAFLVVVKPALAVEELWSDGGRDYSVQRDGNNITLTALKPKQPRAAGIPSLVGTISGATFTGKQYLLADGCPNLEGYVPASGTVSADGNSVKVTFTSSDFFTASCTVNRSFEDSITYTKTSAQNSPTVTLQPSLSPTPTEAPLNLNGTWTTVNEMGTSFTFSGRHVGNSLTMQITDVSDDEVKGSIGKTSLSGTLSGHAFSGTAILIAYAPECLGTYLTTDATGSVAADGLSLSFSYTNFKYKVSTCAKVPGSEFTGSITYVKTKAGKNPTLSEGVKQISPSPEISKPVEASPVGVSSKNFRELVRANAEYQKAQAELEEIKKANDPRYEAKKGFPAEYNSAFKGDDKLKKELEALQADLETVHELVSKGKDWSEIEETVEAIKDGKRGDYGKLDLFTDTVNAVNGYNSLRAKGVSGKDAATKSALDNYGSSALTILPVFKIIDLVATTPDFILGVFGIDEKNWSRKYVTDGVIGKFAPSGLIDQTTSEMLDNKWSDIGNTLKYAWGKVEKAEGILDKAGEAGKLVMVGVGAAPVAIARGLSDIVGGGITLGEKAVGFVQSWFTFSN
ncbi:MAG: hypothetical protein Q7R51_00845 [bacterium]|nr:hypothetical protein [bacterium]